MENKVEIMLACLNNIGSAYYNKGELQKAKEYYD
jgi:hypothetical protein